MVLLITDTYVGRARLSQKPPSKNSKKILYNAITGQGVRNKEQRFEDSLCCACGKLAGGVGKFVLCMGLRGNDGRHLAAPVKYRECLKPGFVPRFTPVAFVNGKFIALSKTQPQT